MNASADRRIRRGSGIFPILNRFLILSIVCVILLGLVMLLRPELRKHREEKARLRALELEIESQRAILERSKQDLHLLKTDPEYLEIIARDKMDLMKEGETIFRIDAGAATPFEALPLPDLKVE